MIVTVLNCNFALTDWLTSLNPIGIIIGGLFGAILGWLISVIYARETDKLKRRKLKDMYSPIAGHFIRQFKQTDRIISTADIDYLNDNKLTIKLTTLINKTSGQDFNSDQIQVWTGEITMDSIKSGFVVWEYRQPDQLIGQNGFKRIIVDTDLQGITLVGETDHGYGVEKLKRK